MPAVPTPPDGIRPGQLGVVILGRVIIGDIAATMADLSVRGMLTVEERDEGDHPGWHLSAKAAGRRLDGLLAYERTLLGGVSDAGPSATIGALVPGMPDVLDTARKEILHDAVSRGWLHRFRHDQRTDVGEQMALRIRHFQRDLRGFASDQGQDALSGSLLPYALHFGMLKDDQPVLARFAHAWVAAFAGLPGWHQPAPSRPNLDQSDLIAKPTIDEQLRDPWLGGAWLV